MASGSRRASNKNRLGEEVLRPGGASVLGEQVGLVVAAYRNGESRGCSL